MSNDSLKFSIEAVPSTLRVTGGREIPFVRPILSLRNTGDTEATGIVVHATLAEDRGIVHDATEALGRATTADSMPPGGELKWDFYDLLLAAHPGGASKIHLWGYRAVLNWWIHLSVSAEYRQEGTREPLQTGVSRWKLRWFFPEPSAERIELALEYVGDEKGG